MRVLDKLYIDGQWVAPSKAADAIEVVQGDLGSLGIGPGSRLSIMDRSCQPSGP